MVPAPAGTAVQQHQPDQYRLRLRRLGAARRHRRSVRRAAGARRSAQRPPSTLPLVPPPPHPPPMCGVPGACPRRTGSLTDPGPRPDRPTPARPGARPDQGPGGSARRSRIPARPHGRAGPGGPRPACPRGRNRSTYGARRGFSGSSGPRRAPGRRTRRRTRPPSRPPTRRQAPRLACSPSTSPAAPSGRVGCRPTTRTASGPGTCRFPSARPYSPRRSPTLATEPVRTPGPRPDAWTAPEAWAGQDTWTDQDAWTGLDEDVGPGRRQPGRRRRAGHLDRPEHLDRAGRLDRTARRLGRTAATAGPMSGRSSGRVLHLLPPGPAGRRSSAPDDSSARIVPEPGTRRPGAGAGLISRRTATIGVPVIVLVAVAALALALLTGHGPKFGALAANQDQQPGHEPELARRSCR